MIGSRTGPGGLTRWPAVLSQYRQGGPIIAVQVENEYGFFYKDEAYMPYLLQVSRLPPSSRAPTLRAAGRRLSVPVNPPAVRAALAWGECAAPSLLSHASRRSVGAGRGVVPSPGPVTVLLRPVTWAPSLPPSLPSGGRLRSGGTRGPGALPRGETLGPQPAGSNQGVSVKRGSHVSCPPQAGAVGGGPAANVTPGPPRLSHSARF